MGYSKRDVASLDRDGSKIISDELTGAGEQDIIQLGVAAGKVSYQSSGNLVCSVEVSLNGVVWLSAGANSTAAAIVSFATHNVVAVRAIWVSGSGKLHIATS